MICGERWTLSGHSVHAVAAAAIDPPTEGDAGSAFTDLKASLDCISRDALGEAPPCS